MRLLKSKIIVIAALIGLSQALGLAAGTPSAMAATPAVRVMRRWLAVPVMAMVVAAIGVFGLAAPPAMASSPCYFAEGGTWFGVTCWTSTHPLIYESENYVVPPEATNTGKSTFALWGGLPTPGRRRGPAERPELEWS